MSDVNVPANMDLPPTSGVVVTPNDFTVFIATRGLWVGVAGDIAVRFIGDGATTVVLKNATGLITGRIDKVLSTGTTATDIVALR